VILVSELVALIDDYRDRHGQPSEASISRAIGAAPQTVNSWRNRGIKEMPRPDLLQRLAEFLRVPLETVVLAAARDAGYLRPRSDGNANSAAPIGETETG
jgi:transcriptional regulator with XRE-family HTH domain